MTFHLTKLALWHILAISFSFGIVFDTPLAAQESNAILNASMEEEEAGYPSNWLFPSRLSDQGYACSLDPNNPFEGKQSALVDATQSEGGRSFGMLNQIIDPAPYLGKRVRFRAAVRTASRTDNGRAQLWFRVDRKRDGTNAVMGSFDNMGDRPITSDDWKHYDIVADVNDDAVSITVGMLVLGKTKAWIDDASFEVVDETIKTTAPPNRMEVSSEAPKQSFFNHWLWLAGIAISLIALSQIRHPAINDHVTRFALTFSIVYWFLYSFPEPLVPILLGLSAMLARIGVPMDSVIESLTKFSESYKGYTEQMVHWAANNVMGIEGQLILPGGSGDTTFSYIRLLVIFVMAIIAAAIWTGSLYRSQSDHTWSRDILRSYLRYVLALTMLGYGLAKAGFFATQFAQDGAPNEFQLARTYGASSPMGLLWTFMAASPMYTFFAGMGEAVGGLLLVFRRTTTLGAMVVFGVMLNVVMLNFCYDVPVKQYSFHLLVMSVFLILPDVPRLANILLFNRSTEPRETLAPPYTISKSAWPTWVYRIFKFTIVFCLFAWPVYEHTKKEIQHEHKPKTESEHLLINRGYRWINEYPYNR